jgi:DNA-binding response OmpR family regulator
MVLEDNGFKVDIFNDPLIALRNFTAGSYDLLLLDIVMPDMNGFELYKKMIMLDDKVNICFLTASGVDHEEYIKKAAFTDATEICFIVKPIENEELIKRVRTLLVY